MDTRLQCVAGCNNRQFGRYVKLVSKPSTGLLDCHCHTLNCTSPAPVALSLSLRDQMDKVEEITRQENSSSLMSLCIVQDVRMKMCPIILGRFDSGIGHYVIMRRTRCHFKEFMVVIVVLSPICIILEQSINTCLEGI